MILEQASESKSSVASALHQLLHLMPAFCIITPTQRLAEVKMKLSHVLYLAWIIAVLAARSGPAAESELKPVAVATFKNGLAFVVRQGDVPLEGGKGRIVPVPAATLGSLWITPNDAKVTLDEVVAYRYKVASQRKLTRLADLLSANAGKAVTLGYSDQKEYTGEIVGLRESEPSPDRASSTAGAAPELALPQGAAPESLALNERAPIAEFEGALPQPLHIVPEFLLLKVEGKLLALLLRNITHVTLPGDPVLQLPIEEERKALRLKVKGARSDANVTMGYLEKGLGWTPSYLVSLQDDKTALITMQAVVIDDAEDLKDTEMFFVVGVPNFAYAHIPSPMALEQTLLDFMQAANRKEGGALGGIASNAILAQRVAMETDQFASGVPSLEAAVEELQGAPEEDLFLYGRSGVTLAKGERATYNMFSGNVNYEHIYQWDVQDTPRVDAFGNVQNLRNPTSPDQAERNNIWHSLRLKNNTKFPWTSAPALVISGTKPVSQDTIPYTPKGAVSNLKLTIATDIRSSHDEREVARQQNVARRRGSSYDEVTVEGTLKIKNYKTKDVRLSITKTLRGNVESQSDEGKAEKLAEAISVDNPMSRLTWEITLQPGEERTISYRYKVWVRA
jgi:hypothetical protein